MLGCEPLAELLFVRGLAFAKEKFSSGFISNRQLPILTGDICQQYDLEPDDLFKQLLSVGLWHEVDGGFLIDGWADWNELDASRAGTYGNHKRWHVARSIVDSACAFCLPVTPTDRPDSGAISPRIASVQISTSKTPSSPSAKAGANGCAADFAAWWSDYPRKVAKQEAERAYQKARKTIDADVIADGLTRWNRQWEREGRPADKIPHAATWLNNARWQDELTDSTLADDDWMKGR
jgi:hypothetical protein